MAGFVRLRWNAYGYRAKVEVGEISDPLRVDMDGWVVIALPKRDDKVRALAWSPIMGGVLLTSDYIYGNSKDAIATAVDVLGSTLARGAPRLLSPIRRAPWRSFCRIIQKVTEVDW